MNPQKKFWKWRNQADGEPEARVLELYGTIASESWFDDDVTPQMFKDELFADDGDVVIYLNSPGGDCIAASQIYTMLMDYCWYFSYSLFDICFMVTSDHRVDTIYRFLLPMLSEPRISS